MIPKQLHHKFMNEENEYAGEDFEGEDEDSMQSDDEDGNN